MYSIITQRLQFRDRFKSLFGEAFQNWFEELARMLHPAGDFQRVRKTSGDGGLDGFVISAQLVYQVYAPARISELNDSETAGKIKTDFQTAANTLAGQIKKWVFIHNHPEAALGKLSVAAISELQSQNPNVEIAVLDIDSLWEKLKDLPGESLATVCAGRIPDQTPAASADIVSDLEQEVSAGFANTRAALEHLPGVLAATMQSVIQSALAESSGEARHLNDLNQKRFDRARDELMHGSIVLAERDYRQLITDLENLGPLNDPSLLFRSYTNLGSSLWQQFRRDEATIWFDKAYALKPNDQIAKTNKAAAHIHRREWQSALDILTALKNARPDCYEASYLISCVYTEQGELDRAIAVLEDRRFENDHYDAALAHAYLRRKDYSRAEEAARKALTRNAKSTDVMAALANSLGFPLVDRKIAREMKAFSLTEAEYERTREAIQYAERAAADFRSQDRSFQLGEVLTNLAAFYELVGNDEKAAQAATEAAERAPGEITTLKNAWASQMRLGKYENAYDVAGRLIAAGAKLDGKIRQLEALLMNSEHDRLLAEAESDPSVRDGLIGEPRFFELKAKAQFGIHQTQAAFSTIGEGLARFPNDARLHCVRASLHEEFQDLDAASADLDCAEVAAPNDPHATLHAAMFYYHQHNWAGAEQRFTKLGANSIHFPFLDSYLVCLHNLGKFSECFTLATKGIAEQPKFNPILHELAARCAYRANDLWSAQQHFELLVQHGAGDVVKNEKMLAQVYLRLDEPNKASAILKKAYAKARRDNDVLIGLSLVSTLRKEHQEAVQYAFTAVNSAGKNPRAHMALVRAVLDCPSDVKLDQKHKRAFHRSLEFLNKHPSGFIKAIPFESDLRSFIAMAKARSDRARQIEDLTRDKNLPMSILAEQLGLTPFQAWMALVGHSRLHVRTAYGTTEEQARELQNALKVGVLSLDAFALFTLRLLKCLDLLPKLASKILVHTKIFEAIVEDIREMETRNSAMTIGYHEGHLIRTEVGPEQIQEHLSFLRDIREFLNNPAVELVGLDPGFISTKEMMMAQEFLGIKYYEPILVAKSRAAAYYADDASLRSLAFNSHGVSCFGTQALLRAAREKKLLTNEQYEDALITLLRHNYHFVSETHETIKRLAEREQFLPTDLARVLLRRVADPNVDEATSIRILSEFCYFIWTADLSNAKGDRDAWLGVCVESILSVKHPEKLLVQFLVYLGLRAIALPTVYDGITSWIIRSGKLSGSQRSLFYLGVQEGIKQMASLATQEYPLVAAFDEALVVYRADECVIIQ